MNELHLFAGAGGGILGSELLGIRTVCAVELEPYPASVLLARQNDGILPPFPVWDDVCTFDGRPWRGLVDVVSGGFPCQDISAAGKGAGIDGARSGLWREMHRIINEVRPKFAFLENSPLLVGRGLARVLGDLAEIGYDAEWLVLGADDVGAPHVRKRIWILAHDPHADGLQRPKQGEPFTGPQVIAGCSLHRLDAGDDVADPNNERSRRRVEFPKSLAEKGVWIGTPTASGKKRSEKFREGNKLPNPHEFVEMFPSPLASDHKRRGPNSRQQGLSEFVRMFPTPTASCGDKESNRKTGKKLITVVSQFPTPRTKGMCGGGRGVS